MEHSFDVGVLHARDDIEGDECHARVAVRLELCECLLRRRILLALVLLDAVNDDVGGKCRHDLHARMCRLDCVHRRLDRLLTRLLERRAKARYDNSILVRIVHHLRILILEDADLRCLHECGGRRLDLGVQLIRGLRRAVRKAEDCRAREGCDQHFLPILHPNSSHKI